MRIISGLITAWLLGVALLVAQAAQFETIDLSADIQRPWGSFQPFSDWTFPAGGRQTFNGVPFDIVGIVQLTGMEHAGKGGYRPARKTFVINRGLTQIHLLHYTEFSSSVGQPVAMLVLRYEQGEPYIFPLRFGVHCMDWYHNPLQAPASGQTTKCVWMAAPTTSRSRQVTGIWHTAIPNPHPARRVKHIEMHSMFAKSTYTLVALTIENGEQPPELNEQTPARRGFPPLVMPASRTLQCVDETTGEPVARAKAAISLRDSDRLLLWGDHLADADGKITLLLPPWNFYALEVIAAGTNHAPTRLSLEDNFEKPTNEVSILKLKRGTPIGGVVRNAKGQGMANALVAITSVEGEPGGFSLFKWPEVRTGANGRWSIGAGNAKSRGLEFRIAHPQFLSAEYEQGEPEQREPWIVTAAELSKGDANMELAAGVTLRGQVLNEAGSAITNARVACFAREEALAQHRAGTDGSGRFSLQNLETGAVALIVSAPGYSPAMLRRTLESIGPELKIELKPSMPLRVKVQTPDGLPIHGAYLQLLEWQRLRPLDSMRQSDTDGMITFEAPLEDAKYLVSALGMTSEALMLRPTNGVHSVTLRPITRTATIRSGPGSRP